jgi:hypothetical protein
MEAQAMVVDPDGHGSVTLWITPDFCLRLWRWTIHLHSFLDLLPNCSTQGVRLGATPHPW